MSADGRYVAFVSSGTVVPGQIDVNGGPDVFLLDRLTGVTKLVSHVSGSSVRTSQSPVDAYFFYGPVISGDGRYVVFCSGSSELVAGFSNLGHNVYIYSRLDESVSLVSHQAGDRNAGGGGNSYSPAVSRDGAYIAFVSTATDLVANSDDSYGSLDIFLLERATGEIRLVSHVPGSETTAAGAGDWNDPRLSISADGGRVAFASAASNLVAGRDGNGSTDVFLYRREHRDVRLVSRAAGSRATAADGGSGYPVVSADGRTVGFQSTASDLLHGFSHGGASRFANVFLYSDDDGTVSLVSHRSGSFVTGGDRNSMLYGVASISADGAIVAFSSGAMNLVAGYQAGDSNPLDVFVYSRSDGGITLVSHRLGQALIGGNGYSRPAAVSADGQTIAFTSAARDLVSGLDVDDLLDAFLFDRATGAVTLATHRLGAPNDAAGMWWPGISSLGPLVSLAEDGQSLAFVSLSAGITEATGENGATSLATDAFLFDRATLTNTLLSRWPGGAPSATANGGSVLSGATSASMSADGRYVAFVSDAHDLVVGQTGGRGLPNVLVHDRWTGTTRLVSHLPGLPTTSLGVESGKPTISANGQRVAFLAFHATSYPYSRLYLWSSEDDSLVLVTDQGPDWNRYDGSGPVISADGDYVAFGSGSGAVIPGTSGFYTQLYLWSRREASLRLVSHVPGQPLVAGNGSSGLEPFSLSRDGRYIVFTSYARNLHGGSEPGSPVDTNQATDVFLYSAATDSIRLVSHAAGSLGLAGNSASESPAMSADGEVVSFYSCATDLTSASGCQVYLYRSSTQRVTLVSHAAGLPDQGGDWSSGGIYGLVVSGDGRHVAFGGSASDLVPGMRTGGSNIFLYSTESGSIRLVSHRPGQATTDAGGWTRVFGNSLSDDGETVLFESMSPNLVEGMEEPAGFQYFVWSASSDEVMLATRSVEGPGDPGNGWSWPAVLSRDGRWVSFTSNSTNLVADDRNSRSDVFLFGPTRPGADLAVGAAAPSTVTPPATVSATFVVVNLGPEASAGVELSLTSPPGFGPPTTSGACPTWPCSIGTLTPGQFVTVSVTFPVPSSYLAPDPAVVSVWASSSTPDPSPANDSAAAAIAVTPRADLELNLTGPASATPPHELTYTLTLTNRGPSDAASVEIDDPTPNALTFVSSGGACPSGFPCTLGSLAPGDSRTATATFVLPESYSGPDPIHNAATATTATVDPNPNNNSSTLETGLDAASAALGYFTMAPCRLLDTRQPDGPFGGPALAGSVERWLTATGSCGIPATARALVVNATVTSPYGAGNLRLWPAGKPAPTASVVSYGATQTRGTSAIVGLNAFGVLAVKATGSPHVHLILDVSGYFE